MKINNKRWYAIDRDSIRDYMEHITECIAVYYANENGYVVEYGGLKPDLLPKNHQLKLNYHQVQLVKNAVHMEGRSDKVRFIDINDYRLALKGGSSYAKAEK